MLGDKLGYKNREGTFSIFPIEEGEERETLYITYIELEEDNSLPLSNGETTLEEGERVGITLVSFTPYIPSTSDPFYIARVEVRKKRILLDLDIIENIDEDYTLEEVRADLRGEGYGAYLEEVREGDIIGLGKYTYSGGLEGDLIEEERLYPLV